MAPRKWKSAPDKPETELAYITKAEKDLILKANIHGGLEKGPNMGPSGIMSLDSFGDADTGKAGGLSGGDVSAAESGSSFAGANTIGKDYGAGLRGGYIASGAGSGTRLNEPQSVLDVVKGLQSQYNYNPNRGSGIFGNLLSGIMSIYNPVAGLFTKKITGGLDWLGNKIQDLRGYNPDGTPRTQAQYEQDRYQRQLQNSYDYMIDRKTQGKGYSEARLAELEALGFGPSRNTLTAAINRDIINEPETPIFSRTYLDSVAARNNVPTNNVPRGNLYQGHTYDFYQGDKGLTSLSNKFSPDISNQVAAVTKQDLARFNTQYKDFQKNDLETLKELGIVNPTMTEYEFDQLKKGNITEPGTYVG